MSREGRIREGSSGPNCPGGISWPREWQSHLPTEGARTSLEKNGLGSVTANVQVSGVFKDPAWRLQPYLCQLKANNSNKTQSRWLLFSGLLVC